VKKFGTIYGLCLGLLSIGLVVSFIGGVIPIFVANKFGQFLSSISGASLEISTLVFRILIVIGILLFYVWNISKRKAASNFLFTVLGIILLVFLNSILALSFADWNSETFKLDYELNSITATFATSWIYVVLGIYHDLIRAKFLNSKIPTRTEVLTSES